jgi:hypothetical protein
MMRRETQKEDWRLFEQVKPTGAAVRKRHSFESVSLYSSDQGKRGSFAKTGSGQMNQT